MRATVNRAKAKTIENIFAIGRNLQRAHKLLAKRGSGGFGKWVKVNCGFSPQCGAAYLRVVKAFAEKDLKSLFKSEAAADALYLLARAGTPPAAISDAVTLAQKGKRLKLGMAKELIAKYTVDNESKNEDGDSELSKDDEKTTNEKGKHSTELGSEPVAESPDTNGQDLGVDATDGEGRV